MITKNYFTATHTTNELMPKDANGNFVRCDYCGKFISGQFIYIEYRFKNTKGYYCDDCAKELSEGLAAALAEAATGGLVVEDPQSGQQESGEVQQEAGIG